MKKLSFISVLTMLLCMVNVKAYAQDLAVRNSDGVLIRYNYINDKTELEVTYFTNAPTPDGKWVYDIIIPEEVWIDEVAYPVTRIGDYAFAQGNLLSVTIPNSVTSIGDYAFRACPISSLPIPNSVTNIGTGAFQYCHSLTSINIPNGVSSIGSIAFSMCSNLTSVNISSSVTSIVGTAFSGCNNLVSMVVDAGNNVYDSRNNCNAIIETSTNTLICGCKRTIIPNNVTSIGSFAFSYCSGLTEITIPNSVASIGSSAFGFCSDLTEITIPNSVTSIGDRAFSDCSGLTEITIPNNVTSIEEYTFYGCSGLTEITIPNSVTSIGEWAFSKCSGLTEITIPNSVTSIGENAFWGCSNLTTIVSLIETPFAINVSLFSNPNTIYNNATLYVPLGKKGVYMSTTGWSNFKNIEEISGSGYDEIMLSSVGKATYCSAYDLDFTGVDGLKAYIASGFYPETGTVLLTNVTTVPAGTGIILMGGEGTYDVKHTSTQFYCVNMLKGTLTAEEVPETADGYTNYVLADGDNGVAFYRSDNNNISANKAYLQIPTISLPNASRMLNYVTDDDMPTGIGHLRQETQQDDAIYNLNGQRVEQPRKGLYIQNGKKIFIR